VQFVIILVVFDCVCLFPFFVVYNSFYPSYRLVGATNTEPGLYCRNLFWKTQFLFIYFTGDQKTSYW